ncbi:MAG: 4-hydroxy-tetrahydrodipicolinate synthase [Gammaproteobacteria bacterium]|nr:4-hydroxy-tetrahydrodipicolinate synthase [Gammaproteobacteria bacterium]
MFKNTMVAIVTPMLENDTIDYESLEKLIDFHLQNQTEGLVILGCTGEAATVTTNERKQIMTQAVRQVAGRISVLSGVGTTSTAETIALAQADAKLGVDGFMIVTPYYNKPMQEGLYQHYKKIAQSVDLPIILYNNPGRTAVDLKPETAARLAEVKNIVGLKESINAERILELRRVVPAEFLLYCGDDSQNLAMLRNGANGVMSVTGNIMPRLMAEMCQAYHAGDYARAEAIHERLMPLHKNLFIETNPIPPKWLLAKMGLINYGIRLPLTRLAVTHEAAVMAAWEAVKTGD